MTTKVDYALLLASAQRECPLQWRGKLILQDMPDNGRDKKPWLPQDYRDVTGGLVILVRGYPWCTRLGPTGVPHGHMLCVSEDATVWRCNPGIPCGTGAKVRR